MSAYTVIIGGGEWSALYEDGELLYAGDHDNVAEKFYAKLGVEVIYSSVPLSQPHTNATPQGVCLALGDAKALIAEAEAREKRAEELRDQAAALVAEAERLERSAS